MGFENFHNRLWFVRIKNKLDFKIPKQVVKLFEVEK
jgi:hypothetical protein